MLYRRGCNKSTAFQGACTSPSLKAGKSLPQSDTLLESSVSSCALLGLRIARFAGVFRCRLPPKSWRVALVSQGSLLL
jgi:hypothetical protein